MALKVNRAEDKVSQPEITVEPVDESMVLELAVYKIYNMGGKQYDKGIAYRFKKEDAMRLLQEKDCDSQVWKLASKKASDKAVLVDVTKVVIPEPDEPIHGLVTQVDVGTDDEISDLLAQVDKETVIV